MYDANCQRNNKSLKVGNMNNPLSKSKVLIANTAIRMKMILFSFGKPLEKKIVFDSFNGKQYSDNPRAISEYIHDHYPDYQIVWKLYKQQEFNIVPDYVRIVRDESSFLKELSTAFCYIRNVEIKTPFYKRKNQLFIQTWHGDRRFKEILKEKPGAHNLRIYDNDLIDIALSSGKFGDESYDSAFDYHGRIQSIGLPRSELMLSYSSVDIERIKQKVGIHGSEKVLLFAPTFRDNESTEQDVTVDIEQVLQELDNKTGFQWMCLMRAHPSSPGLKNLESTHAIIDVSKYPDMTDILAVSDMLTSEEAGYEIEAMSNTAGYRRIY